MRLFVATAAAHRQKTDCAIVGLHEGGGGLTGAAAALDSALAGRLEGVPAQSTVAMCGSGVTACHLLLAMELAGLDGAAGKACVGAAHRVSAVQRGIQLHLAR